MKNLLPKHVLYMAKLFTYAFLIKFLFMSFLLAKARDAQVKNVDEAMLQLRPQEETNEAVSTAERDVTITGVVTDINAEPMPGVTVSVPGTRTGTATSMDGRYSLSVPEG